MPDGKIIVGASVHQGASSRSSIACFEPDGKLHQGFAENGYWQENFNSRDALLVVVENKIVVFGTHHLQSGSSVLFMTRLLADGRPDPLFNDALPLMIEIPQPLASPVAIMHSKGSLIGIANGQTSGVEQRCYWFKVNDDGKKDLGFGQEGIVEYVDQGRLFDGIIQSANGRIVVVGEIGLYGQAGVNKVIGIVNHLP